MRNEGGEIVFKNERVVREDVRDYRDKRWAFLQVISGLWGQEFTMLSDV